MSCVIEMEVLVLGAGSERRQVGITANSEYYFGFNLQSSSRPPAASAPVSGSARSNGDSPNAFVSCELGQEPVAPLQQRHYCYYYYPSFLSKLKNNKSKL